MPPCSKPRPGVKPSSAPSQIPSREPRVRCRTCEAGPGPRVLDGGTMAEEELTAEIFARDGELGLVLPPDVAQRYHLAPGVRVEISQAEEGIVLVPIGVAPWFSP